MNLGSDSDLVQRCEAQRVDMNPTALYIFPTNFVEDNILNLGRCKEERKFVEEKMVWRLNSINLHPNCIKFGRSLLPGKISFN
jgi:hypothetical protein